MLLFLLFLEGGWGSCLVSTVTHERLHVTFDLLVLEQAKIDMNNITGHEYDKSQWFTLKKKKSSFDKIFTILVKGDESFGGIVHTKYNPVLYEF